MTTRRGSVAWGGVVAAALGGCAEARPPRPPASRPPAPPQQGAPTLAADPIKTHEQQLLRPDGGQFERWSYRAETGQGELFYTRFWHTEGKESCLFPSTTKACGLLTVRPKGGAVKAMIHAPHDWKLLLGGREGVYAQRTRGGQLDWIDPQGKASLLLDDRRIEYWQVFWLVELPRRSFLVGGASFGAYTVTELRRPADRPAHLEGFREMDQIPCRSAQDVRRTRWQGKRPLYGDPVLVPLPAEDTWAMVWVEAEAPPYNHPPEKPWRSGAKNGCGSSGPPSRSIADVSVEKQIRVTRFRGTEATGEELVETRNDYDASKQRLEVRVEGDRVRVSVEQLPAAPP